VKREICVFSFSLHGWRFTIYFPLSSFRLSHFYDSEEARRPGSGAQMSACALAPGLSGRRWRESCSVREASAARRLRLRGWQLRLAAQ
jgi:hypothetical protein